MSQNERETGDGGGHRHGGKPTLRIAFNSSPDLIHSVCESSEGGRAPDGGLAERVRRATEGKIRVELVRGPDEPAGSALVRRVNDSAGPDQFDAVLRSIHPDVIASVTQGGVYKSTKDGLLRLVHHWKEVQAHVLLVNASTVDPADFTSIYRGSRITTSLAIHELNLTLMELSMLEGVSIIDVDRIVAELGAAAHVEHPMVYSPTACAAIGEEITRVLADYGFFEDRVLMPQVGQKG